MAKASAPVGRLRQRLWKKNHHMSMRVKGKITCNCASHPPIRSRGLDSVQTTCEKAACLHDATSAFDHEDNLDVDKVANNVILERTGVCRLWTGQTGRLPKQVLYSQLSSGHGKRGRPRLRFKDTTKRNST